MKTAIRNRFLLLTLALAFALSARVVTAHEGHAHSAMGTVAAITADRLDVKTTEGKTETFALTADTKLDRAGKAEPWDKVTVGERVVVHYKKEGAKNVAQHVQLPVKAAEPQATGTTIESSGSTPAVSSSKP